MHSVQVGELKIAYEKIGRGPSLILLHGWANTWEAWLPIIPVLADHFTLFLPDLPGFGCSEGPKYGWSTHLYALWLRGFLKHIQEAYPDRHLFLAGHSFGGKIASLYAAENLSPHLDKLILIDASGIPGRLTWKQKILRQIAKSIPYHIKHKLKTKTKEHLYKAFGAETDYLYANQSQQNTLVKILGEDLRKQLSAIETPTLLIWGTGKKFPPLEHGSIFHSLIHGSEMKTYNSGHFPHHEYPEKVASDIIEFLAKTHIRIPDKAPQSLTTMLAVLQQSEYEWPRFQTWISSQTQPLEIEPKKWTLKLNWLLRLTRITSPYLGNHLALQWWNSFFKWPQNIYFTAMIGLATLKLRGLQLRGLQVIAIAGSYAKTSTKYIMHHCVKDLTPTLMTPENINTPIGIARVILHDLKTTHRLFIAELGEYYPGDITALTRFLHPHYKILTPVGFAHLERFRTQERLEHGLLELLTTLPKMPSLSFEKNPNPTPQATYGISQVQHVEVSRAGTEFDVPDFTKAHVFIPLLGAHNAINTLPTFWLADQLGFDIAKIITRLSTLPVIPHRLEPTLLEHNILLLDNGYNSNPGSANESLAVMDALEGSQKIVITPGFVEMGSEQARANQKFGTQLAKACDFVGVVTGANETALLAGLTEARYPASRIIQGKTEIEVMDTLRPHIKPNAIILFENSLTDVYKKSL